MQKVNCSRYTHVLRTNISIFFRVGRAHISRVENGILHWGAEYLNQKISARHVLLQKCMLITCSRVPLQNLTVAQLVNKFPVLYGTPKFITLVRQPGRGPYPAPYWSSYSQGNTNNKHKKLIHAPLLLISILRPSHLRLGLPSGHFVFQLDFFIYLNRFDGLQGANHSYCASLCYDTVQPDCWASTFIGTYTVSYPRRPTNSSSPVLTHISSM
jgi:hypothetical protein